MTTSDTGPTRRPQDALAAAVERADRASTELVQSHPDPASTPLRQLRWHGLFVLLLAGGSAVRLLDTTSSGGRVLGYHLLGLTAATGAYVLMVRWGVWRWLAAVAAIPALFGTYLRAAEERALPALLVTALLVAAVLVLGWAARPSVAAVLLGLVLVTSALAVAGRYLPASAATAGGDPAAGTWLAGEPSPWAVVLPLGLCLALCLTAALGLARASGCGMSLVCALTGSAAAVIPAAALVDGDLTRRSLLVAVVLGPAAAALALTALMRGRRGRSAAWPQSDAIDQAALDGFDARYGDVDLAPIAVVIAAYNEAGGITGVVAELPDRVCGLSADVIVVDDGSTDGTSDALSTRDLSRQPYVVTPRVNRGQGAALRLGYHIARRHGARYIITTDADGQYDPADLDVVLQPVVDTSADFVTGSRLLGRQETRDRVRRTGVHVFAWIVTAMVGRHTTDTSFGLRAMRAEVTAAVTLNQPQYQSSELLLGVHSHGFRVKEVPARMRMRSAGVSKKGGNAVYGARYARVAFGTWWREGCPFPAPERAAATTAARRR